MRVWDDRDSFVRKTARRLRECDIPEKCRDGFEKAEAVAQAGCNEAKKAYAKVRNYDYGSAFGRVCNKASDGVSFCVRKVRERNPIAVAVCAGVAAFTAFALFFSVFYTVFSVFGKKKR